MITIIKKSKLRKMEAEIKELKRLWYVWMEQANKNLERWKVEQNVTTR